MTPYASNTRTKRNLEMLRRFGWAILITPENPNPPAGLHFSIDNGAWGCHTRKEAFNGDAFEQIVEHHGSAASFVVIPDIVAGGMESFNFSLSWLPRMRNLKRPLLAVQHGMDATEVYKLLRSETRMGIFLGGTTEWKLRTMPFWGGVAAALGRYYHIGRVNSKRRIRLAAEAGADSFDGTSATMFSCNVPRLDAARRQPNLFSPKQDNHHKGEK